MGLFTNPSLPQIASIPGREHSHIIKAIQTVLGGQGRAGQCRWHKADMLTVTSQEKNENPNLGNDAASPILSHQDFQPQS